LAGKCELTAIEFSSIDNTYAWDKVINENDYPVKTLFMDADIETKPFKDIVREVKNILNMTKPQVVAIPGWSSPAAIVALSWCCETGTPVVLMSASTAHDEPRILWKEWIKSRVVSLFSAAIVGGGPHAEYVSALGVKRDRIFTGYDVVDNAYFSTQSDVARRDEHKLRLQLDLPNRYFLASNRFIEKKNLQRLLDAYASYVSQLGANAWDLVLLGDGPLKSMLIDWVACLDITHKVRFLGFKQYAELPVYYGLANVFIQASTTEQWGLVVNEAMASGLPVLVSERCGCAHDLIKNGVNGFTFDPYDVDAITLCMLKVSENSCELAAMGQASQNIIRDWSPNIFAGNMLKAAEVALTVPCPKAGWFDRILMSLLVRR